MPRTGLLIVLAVTYVHYQHGWITSGTATVALLVGLGLVWTGLIAFASRFSTHVEVRNQRRWL